MFKKTLIESTTYDIDLSDFNDTTATVTIDNINVNNLSSLSIYPTDLCKVKIAIADFNELATIGLSSTLMAHNSFYYDPVSQTKKTFSRVDGEDNVLPFIMPNIDDFFGEESQDINVSAGSGDILNIEGVNFGTNTGSVSFRNADNNGQTYITTHPKDIVFWDDNLIRVRMPSNEAGTGGNPAGSGDFIVTTSNNLEDSSYPLDILEVDFAVLNFRTGDQTPLQVNFSDDADGDGSEDGELFFYTDFQTTSEGLTILNDAFCEWNNRTDVQWRLSSSLLPIGIVPDDFDQTNLIVFEDEGEFTGDQADATAFTRITGLRIQSCMDNNSNLVPYLREVDIAIRENLEPVFGTGTTWNYGTDTDIDEVDYKSVVLHERS